MQWLIENCYDNALHRWYLVASEYISLREGWLFPQVRCQHEVYPVHTRQASRQVLIIAEFEVRDRLATSQINKFLYQYTSENMPKQTHANMVGGASTCVMSSWLDMWRVYEHLLEIFLRIAGIFQEDNQIVFRHHEINIFKIYMYISRIVS